MFSSCSVNIFIALVFLGTCSTQLASPEYHKVPSTRIAEFDKLSDVRHLKDTVKRILIPRVVGTPGHDEVRDFIVSSMKKYNWNVELDSFEDDTPNMGRLKFDNIIATLNPNAERFLVLACHYDSKFMKDYEFLGATDSAVPCAMLINMAHSLSKYFQQLESNSDISIKFIFFDGEEAFETWGPKDSIYGARHLANKWNDSGMIKKLDLMVLLDLIGCPDPKFYSFFQNTDEFHARLFYVEGRLSSDGFLNNYSSSSVARYTPDTYFQARSSNSMIEDDHVPFMQLNVPILHIIPVPFPDVWHKKGDNHDVVDYDTVENINKILRIFVLEHLGLFKTETDNN